MKPLLFLANAFFEVFGITQPTPEAAERAAKVLAFMMLGVFIVVITVAALIFRAIYH